MNFQESYTESGLEAVLPLHTDLSPMGRPRLTQEAADLAIAVSKIETVSPTLVCFTHLCEHSFQIAPSLPNVNGHPLNVWLWDIGPYQLSVQWTMRSIFEGDFGAKGLRFKDCFGTSFFEADGVTPSAFNGIPLANGRLAARRLQAPIVPKGEKSAERYYAVHFTGPDHQEKRGGLWDSLHVYFERFFELYEG